MICSSCKQRETFKEFKLCSICGKRAIEQFCESFDLPNNFKHALEQATNLRFLECIDMVGGMAVFGSEYDVHSLDANEDFPTRDLDYDEDYGWSVIILTDADLADEDMSMREYVEKYGECIGTPK